LAGDKPGHRHAVRLKMEEEEKNKFGNNKIMHSVA
jgi:hypothetical protein